MQCIIRMRAHASSCPLRFARLACAPYAQAELEAATVINGTALVAAAAAAAEIALLLARPAAAVAAARPCARG